MEAGEAVLRTRETTASKLVGAALRMLQNTAAARGLFLTFDDQTEDATVVCDARRIRQVLINLVGNALKFTDRGGVAVTASTCAKEGGYIFAVRDTGIGIEFEHLDMLFDPFFQIEHDRNRRYQGTGLGLAIANHAIELHGGRMWAESTIGEGSIFRFILPFETVSSRVTNSAYRMASRETSQLGGEPVVHHRFSSCLLYTSPSPRDS